MEIVLGILTILGFVGTAPQIWGSSWKNIIQFHYRGIVSWESVHTSALRLIDKMEKLSFSPSVVVGIGRGGILSAGLVCSELNKKYISGIVEDEQTTSFPSIKIGTINSKIYFKPKALSHKKNDTLPARIEKIEFCNDDLNVEIDEKDKLMLLVAQNFTGGSLEKALSSFINRGLNRENICTATIFWHMDKRIRCSHEPDLYGRVVSASKTMPWKTKEDSTDRY